MKYGNCVKYLKININRNPIPGNKANTKVARDYEQ